MGNGTENLMERHEEEEKRERDKRNRWRKRLKILMILGVFQRHDIGFCKISVCRFYSIGNFLYVSILVVLIL